jgi:hypothetical protein
MDRAFDEEVVQDRARAEAPFIKAASYLLLFLLALLGLDRLYAAARGEGLAAFAHTTAFWMIVGPMITATGALDKYRRRMSGRLRVDERGISFDGERLAARETILRGALAPSPDGTARASLTVKTSLGAEKELRFVFSTEEAGRRFLATCGVGPEQRTFGFRAALSPWSAAWLVIMAIAMIAATVTSAVFGVWTGAPAMPILVTLLLSAALAAGLRYARAYVEIGVDGVRLSGIEDRFICRNDIQSVRVVPPSATQRGTVVLAVRGGPQVHLRPPASPGLAAGELEGVADRIERSRALPPSATHLRECQGLLARGRRPLTEWLASARALGAARTDYRTSPFDVDDLSAMVTDGSLRTDVRLGAALALRSSPIADAAQRVRVAAAACASPGLRVCLDSIADEDGDPIAEKAAAVLHD